MTPLQDDAPRGLSHDRAELIEALNHAVRDLGARVEERDDELYLILAHGSWWKPPAEDLTPRRVRALALALQPIEEDR